MTESSHLHSYMAAQTDLNNCLRRYQTLRTGSLLAGVVAGLLLYGFISHGTIHSSLNFYETIGVSVGSGVVAALVTFIAIRALYGRYVQSKEQEMDTQKLAEALKESQNASHYQASALKERLTQRLTDDEWQQLLTNIDRRFAAADADTQKHLFTTLFEASPARLIKTLYIMDQTGKLPHCQGYLKKACEEALKPSVDLEQKIQPIWNTIVEDVCSHYESMTTPEQEAMTTMMQEMHLWNPDRLEIAYKNARQHEVLSQIITKPRELQEALLEMNAIQKANPNYGSMLKIILEMRLENGPAFMEAYRAVEHRLNSQLIIDIEELHIVSEDILGTHPIAILLRANAFYALGNENDQEDIKTELMREKLVNNVSFTEAYGRLKNAYTDAFQAMMATQGSLIL